MKPEIMKLGEGIELYDYRNWVEDADRVFAASELLSFTDEIVTRYRKPSLVRRRTVDYGLPYSYNETAKQSIEWEPLALTLKQKLEQQFGIEFPQCACNEYVDAEAYIGPHHDKSIVVGNEKREPLFVAVVSLGSPRMMVLTPPGANLKGVSITVNALSKVPGSRVIEVAPGSLLVFSNAFNRTWKHSIPKDLKSAVVGKRTSLTYRNF